MAREHHYTIELEWTGNTGAGTRSYTAYERAYSIASAAQAPILGSSDPAFRGDPGRWNPEQMLLAAISACHQLWYLHLCAVAGVVVISYRDRAEARMVEDASGGGRFVEAVLRPDVTIAPGCDEALAIQLHGEAHAKCFIASSLNFPISHEPRISVAGAAESGGR